MSYPPRVIINFALLVYLTSFSSSVQIFEHNRGKVCLISPSILITSQTAEKYTNYWYKNAQEDLETSLKIEYLKSQAKHVILFIGDGMSLTTLTGMILSFDPLISRNKITLKCHPLHNNVI